MVLLFSAIGLFLWVAVLLAVLVFSGIIWLFCLTMLWLMDPYGRDSALGTLLLVIPSFETADSEYNRHHGSVLGRHPNRRIQNRLD